MVADRGRAAGHREVLADVLDENVAAQALITSVFPAVTAERDGPAITFTADLTDSVGARVA